MIPASQGICHHPEIRQRQGLGGRATRAIAKERGYGWWRTVKLSGTNPIRYIGINFRGAWSALGSLDDYSE